MQNCILRMSAVTNANSKNMFACRHIGVKGKRSVALSMSMCNLLHWHLGFAFQYCFAPQESFEKCV